MAHPTDVAVVCKHEFDYDGTFVLRGFRNGFALAGLVWLSIGLATIGKIGFSLPDLMRGF